MVHETFLELHSKIAFVETTEVGGEMHSARPV